MILADTSVWVEHLRRHNAALSQALEAGSILMHPFVIGELASGNLRNRAALLALWSDMPAAPAATHDEVLEFIDRQKLMGSGLGYIDVHLVAAVALTGGGRLWTRDVTLGAAARRLGMAYAER